MTRRGLRLGLGAVVPVAIEVELVRTYLDHDGLYHWFTHFFVGASVALVAMAVVTMRRKRAVGYPLVWVLIGHLYAGLPDLFFMDSVPHQRWQDIFFAHVSSHFVPGGNLTWAVILSLALGGYLVAVDRTTSSVPERKWRPRHA